MKTSKKLYLVSREVMATSVEQALKGRGKVYSVLLAAEKDQPVEGRPLAGFKINHKNDKK